MTHPNPDDSHASTSSAPTHPVHDGHVELTRREVVTGALGLGLAAACSSADASELEAKAPLPAWNGTTRAVCVRTTPSGAGGQPYVAGYAGEKALPTGTFDRYRSAREGASTAGEFWVQRKGPRSFVVGGAEYTSESAAALKLPGSATITLDTPFELNLDAPVGVPQPGSITAKLALGGAALTTASASGTYTVVSRDATATATSGLSVSGCTHLRIEAEVPVFFGATVKTKTQVWYSDTVGFVNVVLDEPLGLGFGVQGSRSSRDLSDGYASVEGVGVVGKGAGPRFAVSSHDAKGAFDADKETHAKMLVELRWVDEAAAKTDKRPYVDADLGTVMGTFPAELTQAPVSFFHPEENGKGYVYWYYYADQAAKNEAENGIAYHAGVRYDPSFSPLRVTARVVYKRL